MSKYKLLIADLDGTLTPELGMPPRDFTFSSKLTKSVNEALNHISVSLCTGRDKDIALKAARLISLKDPQIIEGGAKIIDIKGNILWAQYIDEETCSGVINILKKVKRDFAVVSDGVEFFNELPNDLLHITAILLFDLNAEELTSLQQEVSEFKDLALALNTDRAATTVYITDKNGTKTSGVKKLREILGVKKEEVIGVGDRNNDKPLLLESGLKVAMGNADEELKEIADFIAPTVEEDGVVAVIEKFVL